MGIEDENTRFEVRPDPQTGELERIPVIGNPTVESLQKQIDGLTNAIIVAVNGLKKKAAGPEPEKEMSASSFLSSLKVFAEIQTGWAKDYSTIFSKGAAAEREKVRLEVESEFLAARAVDAEDELDKLIEQIEAMPQQKDFDPTQIVDVVKEAINTVRELKSKPGAVIPDETG